MRLKCICCREKQHIQDLLWQPIATDKGIVFLPACAVRCEPKADP